jgi:arginase
VVGGCCTLLIGVFAAIRDCFGQIGLAFVDGHLDFYDGWSSPTGEAADMDLAILTGFGPSGLADLAVPPPLVEPKNVVVIGYRDAETAAAHGSPDPALKTPSMVLYDAKTTRRRGPALLGEEVERRFIAGVGRFWLHLDFDVLDEKVMPAVDYPQSDGLDWEELCQLVSPFARSSGLVGTDVTIYNPAHDKDARYASRIVEFLERVFIE